MTPANWDPHSPAYAENEGSFLDWEGQMSQASYRNKSILSKDLPTDQTMASALHVANAEHGLIDSCIIEPSPSTMTHHDFECLNDYDEIYRFKLSIGSTSISIGNPDDYLDLRTAQALNINPILPNDKQ